MHFSQVEARMETAVGSFEKGLHTWRYILTMKVVKYAARSWKEYV